MAELEFWHHHGGISVPNLEEAIRWWDEKLNFKVERRGHIPAIPADIAFVKNGNLRIELFEAKGSKPASDDRLIPDTDAQTHGNLHVSFACDNAPALAEVLRARGVDIVWVKMNERGGNCFIRTNSGALVEFVSMPKPEPAPSIL